MMFVSSCTSIYPLCLFVCLFGILVYSLFLSYVKSDEGEDGAEINCASEWRDDASKKIQVGIADGGQWLCDELRRVREPDLGKKRD